MEIVGYLAIILAGVSIGLIGAGGGILTVPILVYLFAVNPVLATAYSLFLVGSTSLVGVIPKYLSKNISFKTAVIFGAPSMISVFLTRKFILPEIPQTVFYIGEIAVSKSLFLMVLFAVLMIFAAKSMLKKKPITSDLQTDDNSIAPIFVSLLGFMEGCLTGLVGAGGGFIIIPILTLLAKVEIKKAIGTSLLIVAVKSLIGSLGDVTSGYLDIDWKFLFLITSLSIFGMFIGNALSKKIDGQKLKSGFGWFILIMGIYILIKEVSRL